MLHVRVLLIAFSTCHNILAKALRAREWREGAAARDEKDNEYFLKSEVSSPVKICKLVDANVPTEPIPKDIKQSEGNGRRHEDER